MRLSDPDRYLYGKSSIWISANMEAVSRNDECSETLGWKAGVITFLGDSFKCIIAVVLVHLIFGKTHADIIQVLAMYTGMGVVLGSQLSILYEF